MAQLTGRETGGLVKILVGHVTENQLERALEFSGLPSLAVLAGAGNLTTRTHKVVKALSKRYQIIEFVEGVYKELDQQNPPLERWLQDNKEKLQVRKQTRDDRGSGGSFWSFLSLPGVFSSRPAQLAFFAVIAVVLAWLIYQFFKEDPNVVEIKVTVNKVEYSESNQLKFREPVSGLKMELVPANFEAEIAPAESDEHGDIVFRFTHEMPDGLNLRAHLKVKAVPADLPGTRPFVTNRFATWDSGSVAIVTPAALDILLSSVISVDVIPLSEANRYYALASGKLELEEQERLKNIERQEPQRIRTDSKYWPNGSTLNVFFLDGDESLRQVAREAASLWAENANLDFHFVNDAAESEIRISFEKPGAYSYMGTDALGIAPDRETMNLGNLNLLPDRKEQLATALHEFGHVLGLIHEHQSPNANIDWDWPVIYEQYAATHNWSRQQVDRTMRASADVFPGYEDKPYDPESIMSYEFADKFYLSLPEEKNNGGLSLGDKAFVGEIYPFN